MNTQQLCVECHHDISHESMDYLELNIDPKVYLSNQVHLTCLGKAVAFGQYSPTLAAGLRGALPQDLIDPNSLTGQLYQLGIDLHLYGASVTPLSEHSRLRYRLAFSNIDILAANRQIQDQVHDMLTRHVDQHPDDEVMRVALTDRALMKNISAEEVINPPLGIQVTACYTMVPRNTSSSDVTALEAKAIKTAQKILQDRK